MEASRRISGLDLAVPQSNLTCVQPRQRLTTPGSWAEQIKFNDRLAKKGRVNVACKLGIALAKSSPYSTEVMKNISTIALSLGVMAASFAGTHYNGLYGLNYITGGITGLMVGAGLLGNLPPDGMSGLLSRLASMTAGISWGALSALTLGNVLLGEPSPNISRGRTDIDVPALGTATFFVSAVTVCLAANYGIKWGSVKLGSILRNNKNLNAVAVQTIGLGFGVREISRRI